VKFYTSEIKGNLDGTLPVDFTTQNPPPPVPSEVSFTDVTIGLVYVQCDTLTAAKLGIATT
jgi:hypothetical protein